MKVLLIAKPWRGGLARYLHAALETLLPGSVTWVPTYPTSLAERVSYRRNRTAWRTRLAERVAGSACDAAIFINHVPGFEALPARDQYVLWITDDPLQVTEKSAPYPRLYITDPGYRQEIAATLGDRFRGVLGFGYLPDIHKPQGGSSQGRGFCFIGNRDPKRDPYLRCLLEGSKSIRVYGNYFPLHPLCWRFPGRFLPAVSIERMAAIYSRHLASINIHAQVVRGGTNMRTFECAGYGIAQIVERLPGLEALFSPGEDVLTFDSPEELVNQITRLENDPKLVRALARSSASRARAEHTYFHRARELLDGLIEISPQTVARLAGK